MRSPILPFQDACPFHRGARYRLFHEVLTPLSDKNGFMLYEKPVAELMRDAATSLVSPMSPSDIISWFQVEYPLVQVTTIKAHITGLTSNNKARKHFPSLAKRVPVFYQMGKGSLVCFDPELHDGVDVIGVPLDDDEGHELGLEIHARTSEASVMEFALEAYLEEFIVTNWHLIDWGRRLEIWDDGAGQSGHQLSTPVGRLDLLTRDLDSGELVVIELKRGKSSDQVVGQAARYMGWVRHHLTSDGQTVSGIVVAGDVDDRLRYAASAIPNLTLRAYQVNFALVDVGLTDPLLFGENPLPMPE